VHRLLGLDGRAQRPGLADDTVEHLGRACDHLHAAQRCVRLVLADLELFDCEVAADVHDQVHDLGQHHRVDDVTLQDEASRVSLGGHQRSAPTTALISS
jgi:hypothetical protein